MGVLFAQRHGLATGMCLQHQLEERLCCSEEEIDTVLCASDKMLAGASRHHGQREREGDSAMTYSQVSGGRRDVHGRLHPRGGSQTLRPITTWQHPRPTSNPGLPCCKICTKHHGEIKMLKQQCKS
jgi:hypothetical protein